MILTFSGFLLIILGIIRLKNPDILWRSILSIIIGITLIIYEQLTPSLRTFTFIDANGHVMPAHAVPSSIENASAIPLKNTDLPSSLKPAYVLARVFLPKSETSSGFGSSLVSSTWYGGLHCEDAVVRRMGYQRLDTLINDAKRIVCIRLIDFNHPSKLVISKLGYKTVELPIPYAQASGHRIWMGDIHLEAFNQTELTSVQGHVITPDGAPLPVSGKAYLRVNGTLNRKEANIQKGTFSFSGISPGQYLVEFIIPHYSVKTWWVTVPERSAEPVNTTLTAFSSQIMTLRLLSAQNQFIPAYIQDSPSDHNRYITIDPTHWLRMNQEGQTINLYSPHYKIDVIRGPFSSRSAIALQASEHDHLWFSWRGSIEKGNLIVLLKSKFKNQPQKEAFDETQIAGIIDVDAISTQ